MSKSPATMRDLLKLLPQAVTRTSYNVQLSLFDEGAINRLVCVPMGDLHGQTFMRVVTSKRPRAVVDVRRHPYFGLASLSRDAAFALFRHAATNYVHLPLDLRHPPDQRERWKLRQSATQFLSAIVPDHSDFGSTFIILMHNSDEANVFDAAIRNTRLPGDPSWVVERI